MKRLLVALALGAALSVAVSVAPVQAQEDWIDEGGGYHVTWHGWSEDGWAHWQNDCYAWGCTGWYVVNAGP